MTRGKGPQGIGDALRSIATRLDQRSGGGLLQARVAAVWAKVAGASVDQHTTGAHLRDGELVVFVDSPVWASELSALSEHYREALEKEIGKDTVHSVRFAVSRRVDQKRAEETRQAEEEKEKSADQVPSVPLTEQERAQVEASAAVIENDELREAAIRATVADLEWKKGIELAKRREKAREGL